MNYTDLYAADVAAFYPSPVRDLLRTVDMSTIISLSGGYPSPDTFPTEELRQIISRVLDTHSAEALQYGSTEGVVALRREILRRYALQEVVRNLEEVVISSSSQQGIDLITRLLIDPGDVVLCLNPTYLGALQSFRAYRATIVGLDFDKPEKWKSQIATMKEKKMKVKFFYVIPDFMNPSGECLDMEQRRLLVELAQTFDFMIVEDTPYRELRYLGDHLPMLLSMAPDHVIQLRSFSKTFAPALRLGWVCGPKPILRQWAIAKQAVDLCPSALMQYIVCDYMCSGQYDSHLQTTLDLYRKKKDFMLACLEKYMPSYCTWSEPQGGLFVFVRFPEPYDTTQMYAKALEQHIAYVPGEFFHVQGGKNTLRLNFSNSSFESMKKAIQILARLF